MVSERTLCLSRQYAARRRALVRRQLLLRLGIGLLVALLLWLGAAGAGYAHWKPKYAGSPWQHWFESQTNSQGFPCCGKADAHFYDDGYTVHPDGSITLANGEKIDAYKVLKDPNPTGRPILWQSAGRSPIVYCFAPGAMG